MSAITEPIRDKRQVRALTEYYLKRGQLRNHVLLVMGVHTALRVSDLLRLTWGDVYDGKAARPRSHAHLSEGKTGKRKVVALNAAVAAALKRYARSAPAAPSTPLFRNKHTNRAISRIQAYRLIRAASVAVRLPRSASCHSLRKTFGYHAWKAGVSPAVIMDIYNHSSMAVTRRYLGVAQDDRDEVYRGMSFLA